MEKIHLDNAVGNEVGKDIRRRDDIYGIIAEVFRVKREDVHDNLGPEDIESWDSLGQLALISALESHYRTTFEIEEIFEIVKVRDIKRLLAKRGIK